MVGGRVLGGRLVIGLAQGVALFLLFRAADLKLWPATDPQVLAPVALVCLFVPLIALAGWPGLRLRTLLSWAAVAALILAGVALHDVTWHDAAGEVSYRAPALVFFCAAGLFIAQALIAAGDAERRIIARYPACFDAAWKLGVQAVLTVAFTGAFWLILWLGSGLFDLIGLEAFGETIGEAWFWIPATTLAIAAALHVTDVQPAIVRGIRTLKLTLLSWLLPVLTGIVLVFLASLPFTGLAPLWATKAATPILLAVMGGLVLLINAAYQDGGAEQRMPRLMRFAMAAAALALLPLVAIGIYGLGLRVGQHGWTAERIWAAAAVALAATYAAGYAWGLARSGLLLRQLETTNLAAALGTLAILLALFTPIADPARLAVASQIGRFTSGAVAWADIDLRYLRFDGGRYGQAALERLMAEATDPAVLRDIETALAAKSRYDIAVKGTAKPAPPSAEALRANLTLHPPGAEMPADFPLTGWGAEIDRLGCLSKVPAACDVFLMDLNGDGAAEIILADRDSLGSVVFTRRDGRWLVAGFLDGLVSCKPSIAAMKEGKARAAPSPWSELSAGGQTFALTEPGRASCY